MGLRGTPRTLAPQPRTVIGFRPARTTFVALRALSCLAIPPAEAGRRPSMYLRSPSEDIPRKPRIATTRSPGHKGRLREQGLVLPLVDFCHPTAHAGAVNRVLASGSLRRHSPRARFEYLLRDSFTAPADTTSRIGAPMGFPLQGIPLNAIGPPFGGHTLMTLPRTHPSPRREKAGTWPPSRLHSRVESVQTQAHQARVSVCFGRRSLPEVLPLQSSSPA